MFTITPLLTDSCVFSGRFCWLLVIFIDRNKDAESRTEHIDMNIYLWSFPQRFGVVMRLCFNIKL